jgi:hypothetical protein
VKVASRTKNIAKWAAVPAGLLASGLLVLGYSNAAFTATTSNDDNSWKTGTISLTDNDLTKPLFSRSTSTVAGAADAAIKPGQTLTRSIDITYTGDVPANVKLSAAVGTQTGGLADKLDVTVTEGGANIYTGPLSGLTAPVGNWAPTGNATKTYVVNVTLNSGVDNTFQGKTVDGTNFTWVATT